MDTYGLIVFLGCLIGYFATKSKYPFLLFASGFGGGVFVALIWAYIVSRGLLP